MTFHLYSLIQEAFMEGNSMQDWVVGSVGNGVASSLGGRGRKPGTKITGDKWLSSLAHQNHWGVLKAPMPRLPKGRK